MSRPDVQFVKILEETLFSSHYKLFLHIYTL